MTLAEYDAEHHNLKAVTPGLYGGINVWQAECWCGQQSEPYIQRVSAIRAHERHQQRAIGRAAMQASFAPRLHL